MIAALFLATFQDLANGTWKAELTTPGGPLAFDIAFERGNFRITADYHREEELARGDRSYFDCGEQYIFDEGTGDRADIIDPRTGRSPEHSSGTTIRSGAAMHADALSTSVFVLGPVEGIALLDRLDGVEGMLVTKTGEQVASRGFGATLA